jgi:hypothetical protein
MVASWWPLAGGLSASEGEPCSTTLGRTQLHTNCGCATKSRSREAAAQVSAHQHTVLSECESLSHYEVYMNCLSVYCIQVYIVSGLLVTTLCDLVEETVNIFNTIQPEQIFHTKKITHLNKGCI